LPDGREFYKGDPEKLNSKDFSVQWNEESKVESGYFNALEDALKAACGERAGGKPE
jgi:hypothetical protein